MKKTLFLLSMLAVAACTADNIGIEEPASSDVKFYASFEGADLTKTYLDNDGYIRWNADDSVSIFAGKTYNQQFRFDGSTGDSGNSFTMVGSPGTGTELQANYSVYPYSENNLITPTGVLGVTLPDTQVYAENSFGLNANTMVAVTENVADKHLRFKNVCGYLKMSLYGDATIKSITLRGNNRETIAGMTLVNASFNGTPSTRPALGATESITIDCGEGVALGATQETATVFYFVVPPVEFSNGITITATAADGRVLKKTTTRPLKVERNKISKMSALEYDEPFPFKGLTFTADEESTIALNKQGQPEPITLEYSKDNYVWTSYTIGETINLEAGEYVYFRAGEGGNQTFSDENELRNFYYFSMAGRIRASGNIMSLLDRTLTRNSVPKNCFNCLFIGCNRLFSAPKLPATELAEGCYYGMFANCNNLETAPELPATTLALACYLDMFLNCTSLTTAPELPALNLAPLCYTSMFQGCSNLVTAPELPATTLTSNCYQKMFDSCEKLNYVKMLATDIPDTGFCLSGWLNGVASEGNIYLSKSLPDEALEKLNLPEDWHIWRND
ncbi:MAG: fimbrillin family protein [Bacteroidales bacterium]|nr:fimbrillin family protein [Bacteroidales bacterium]